MERRIFLKSMLGFAGAAAAATVFTSRAEASPLFDELKAMDAKGVNPLNAADVADLPAPGAAEAQYYYGGYRRRRYVRPVYRRRVRRCRVVINRWGRAVRQCWVG